MLKNKGKKNRSYVGNCLDFGLFWFSNEFNHTTLCVVCGEKLAHEAMVSSKLKRFLSLKHDHRGKSLGPTLTDFRSSKNNSVMLSKQVKVSNKAQEAIDLVAKLVVKNMNSHTIAPTLILLVCSAIVKPMFGSETEKQ